MNPHSTFLKSTWDRVDSICDRFEADRRKGTLQPLSSYVPRQIRGAERDFLLRELLALEIELVSAGEESVILAKFLSTLPEDAQLIQRAYERLQTNRSQRATTKAPETSQVEIGAQLGPYTIMSHIGAGGMGQVYKARHFAMERMVALKVLSSDLVYSTEALRRFRREIRAAARLNHPNIVSAFDAGEDNGVHFLVMQFIDGRDLASFVKSKGPLSVQQAARCTVHAAKGLEYAHQQGVVHRDIKPHNLMVDRKGVIRVLDLGLARFESSTSDVGQSELTGQGTLLGTVDYMAPEQTVDTRTADRRADIYSLGCTLHFLLTGRPVYDGDTIMKRILAHRESQIPQLLDSDTLASSPLESVFQRMVAKSPEDRYQCMSEVIIAIRNSVNQASDSNRPDAPLVITGSSETKTRADLEATRAIRNDNTLSSGRWGAALSGVVNDGRRITPVLWITAIALIVIFCVVAFRVTTRGSDPIAVLASSSIRKAPIVDISVPVSKSTEIESAIQSLIESAPNNVVAAVDKLSEFEPSLVRPRLLESYVAFPDSSAERRNISLALLPMDDGQIEYLARRFLMADSTEFQLLIDSLKERAESVAPILWTFCASTSVSEGQKLRTFAALAELDLQNESWSAYGNQILRALAKEEIQSDFWMERLDPAAEILRPSLIAAFGDDDADLRNVATRMILRHAGNQGKLLAALVPQSVDSTQFALLEGSLRQNAATAVPILEDILVSPPLEVAPKEALQSQLRVAAMLMRLGQMESVFDILADPDESAFRSQFVVQLPNIVPGIGASDLLTRTNLPMARAALFKSLGLRQKELTVKENDAAVAAAKASFQETSDVVEHSMAEWFLRRAGQSDWLVRTVSELSEEPPDANRNWYVNKSGITMAVFRFPNNHSRAGDRFAISTHEIPVSLFTQFRESNPDFSTESTNRMLPLLRNRIVGTLGIDNAATWPNETATDHIRAAEEDKLGRPEQGVELTNYSLEVPQPPDLPVTRISWFEAAAVCRWVSEVEGFDDRDICIPRLSRFEPAQIGVTAQPVGNANNYDLFAHVVFRIRTDPMICRGYRLPTLQEWNFAKGAAPIQQGPEAKQKAEGLSADATVAIGWMAPNDHGMFGLPGNVREWCFESPESAIQNPASLPARFGDRRAVADRSWRASTWKGRTLKSAGPQYASFRAHDLGFRIARSLPPVADK